MHPKDINIADFSYELPDERIARYPLPVRDEAKLLVYRNGTISDRRFTELPGELPYGTLMIGNATRVIHARLHARTENDKLVEVFCLDPITPADYQRTFAATESVVWKCLIGGNRKWKRGKARLEVTVDGTPLVLEMERLERVENAFAVRFTWRPLPPPGFDLGGAFSQVTEEEESIQRRLSRIEDPKVRAEGTSSGELGPGGPRPVSFGEVLDAAGQIPLPPYLGREAEESDRDRYQTVFAQVEGSVAAPTAGLHLSERLMDRLAEQNMNWAEVILHVGAGTFKPVTTDTIGGHEMHAEYFEVDRNFLERLAAQLRSEQPIVGVGTTSTRCLESLYYLGSLARRDKIDLSRSTLSIDQWVTVDHPHNCTALEAIEALLAGMERHRRNVLNGSTRLILTPGTRMQIIDGLITNFHQPNSTLLLIVAAVTGADWRKIYDHALANDYRFLSYGDGSLLWKKR